MWKTVCTSIFKGTKVNYRKQAYPMHLNFLALAIPKHYLPVPQLC